MPAYNDRQNKEKAHFCRIELKHRILYPCKGFYTSIKTFLYLKYGNAYFNKIDAYRTENQPD